jgi:hypothetical protein
MVVIGPADRRVILCQGADRVRRGKCAGRAEGQSTTAARTARVFFMSCDSFVRPRMLGNDAYGTRPSARRSGASVTFAGEPSTRGWRLRTPTTIPRRPEATPPGPPGVPVSGIRQLQCAVRDCHLLAAPTMLGSERAMVPRAPGGGCRALYGQRRLESLGGSPPGVAMSACAAVATESRDRW